jgi:3-methyladenine DNA glycosylase AlkC
VKLNLISYIDTAFTYAKEQKHQFITPEHILFIFIKDSGIKMILEECDVDVNSLYNLLEGYLDTIPKVENPEPLISIEFRSVIERAMTHVLSAEKKVIEQTDVLISIFEEEGQASFYLKKLGATHLRLMEVISNCLHKQFSSYEEALTIFTKILTPNVSSFASMYEEGKDMAPISKYVEIYGIQNPLYFEQTIEFIKKLTLAYTGEYALRSMFIVMPSNVIEVVKEWIKDTDPFIRRVAIESIRISLPWAKKTYNIINYLKDYQHILDVLSKDKNEYVRRSVANNINDLYKYDIKRANAIINKWEKRNIKNPSKEMTKLINHATRYYRNKILALHGFVGFVNIEKGAKVF